VRQDKAASPRPAMRRRIASIASTLRSEVATYRAIARDPRTPRAAKLLLGAALGYLLLPFDLIPDFLPVIGHLDDAIIVPGLVWLALRRVPKDVVDEHRGRRSPQVIPRGVLFGADDRSNPKVSPDATRLGWIGPHRGAANVFVDGKPLTSATGRGIGSFMWEADSCHVIYSQDRAGDENWRLFRTNVDTGDSEDLTPFEGVQAVVLATSQKHPDTIAILLNQDESGRHDVYRLKLSTGELEPAARNEGFSRWVVDSDLRVRAAVKPRADGGCELLVRDDEASDWRVACEFGVDDALEVVFDSHPMWFSNDGNSLYFVTTKGAETARLVRFDIADGSMTTIAEDPNYDILDVLYHPKTREPQAALLTRERTEYIVIDPSIEDVLKALRDVRPGDAHIGSRDDDDNTWIVGFASDDDPGAFYRYHRNTKEFELVFERQPELKKHTLARTESFTFEARDGLQIQGYLTFPREGRKNVPTVVKVHGGPEYRDRWGFDPWAQFFADRGCLCVQVNYRGSIGFGKNFMAAARKEWGRAMHHDVVDAIHHVIDRGYADPDRIAMWGTSYGGYETLWCAATEPDLLTCAVAGMAPVNLLTFMDDLPSYWVHVRAMYRHRLGDPETDEDMLRERSPLTHAHNITAPLLVFYGDHDPRVRVGEAGQLKKVLDESGVPHEMHILKDEGHFVSALSPKSLDFMAVRTEAFLAEHLGGRAEPPMG